MRVLIVEDDAELADILSRGLEGEGIETESAATYAEGRRRAVLGSYDVIMLDILLPGGSGLDLCRYIRERDVRTPVLMLTARDAVPDRVAGLESGADDYLTKPFDLRELLARIRALARRPPELAPEVFEVDDLTVDLRSRRVERADASIRLTAKEWDLLEFFVRNHDRVVDRAEITSYVWDENHDPFSNALEMLVARLRRKIDAEGAEPLIHTIRGAGYRFGASST